MVCWESTNRLGLDLKVSLLPVVEKPGGILWQELFKKTKQLGIESILVEGGAYTHSQLLKQRASQRIYAFLAPYIIGGEQGLSWSENLSIDGLDTKVKLDQPELVRLGSDLLYKTKLI